jgi:hypothetical protein
MEIKSPAMTIGRTTEERLKEIERYLFYLSQQLNFNFNDIESTLNELQKIKSFGGK